MQSISISEIVRSELISAIELVNWAFFCCQMGLERLLIILRASGTCLIEFQFIGSKLTLIQVNKKLCLIPGIFFVILSLLAYFDFSSKVENNFNRISFFILYAYAYSVIIVPLLRLSATMNCIRLSSKVVARVNKHVHTIFYVITIGYGIFLCVSEIFWLQFYSHEFTFKTLFFLAIIFFFLNKFFFKDILYPDCLGFI